MKISKTSFWFAIFTMLFSIITILHLRKELNRRTDTINEKIQQLGICRLNLAEIEKQIGSGRIILELKK